MRRVPALALALVTVGASLAIATIPGEAAALPTIDVSACFAEKVSVDRSGTVAYVGCSTGGVAIADLSTGTLRSATGIESGDLPTDVVAGDGFALAALPMAQEIRKILPNGTSTRLRAMSSGDTAMALDLTPSGRTAVIGVAGAESDYLAIAPLATKVSTTVALLGAPVKVSAFTANGTDYAYVVVNAATPGRFRVQTVNLDKAVVVGSVLNVSSANGDPVGLQTSPDGSITYLLQASGLVSVLKSGSATPDHSIRLGAGVWRGLSFAPDGNWAYALGTPAATGTLRVSVINVPTERVTSLTDSINDQAMNLSATTRGRIVLNQFDSLAQIVTAVPVVASLSKDTVSAYGRTSLIVRGINLGNADVFIGGEACVNVGSSDTSITCTTPQLSSLDDAAVTVRSAAGPVNVGTVHVTLPSIDEPVRVDAFTSDTTAIMFFDGSSLATSLMKGYKISIQTNDASGRASEWRELRTTSGTKTAFTFTRAELGVAVGDLVRFRVQTVAANGQLSTYSLASPWRQMIDAVAPPTDFAATYDKTTDYLTMTWKAPSPSAPGGRNFHGYAFQYKWPGSKTWTELTSPLSSTAERAVFSLENVPKGTFTVRIRAIGWPERLFSAWTTEAAIRK